MSETSINSSHIGLIADRLESKFGKPERKRSGKFLNSLIRTVLSQSTNDRNRDVAYNRLRQRFPDWQKVKDASLEEITEAIRPAGLSNQKSKHIKELLEWIDKTYGTFDLDFLCDEKTDEVIDAFMQRRGVGIKTISVVLMFACGVDIFPVDTHVHRICRRLGLVPENASAEKTHLLMQPLIPEGRSFSLHINMLSLGRTLCKARHPSCPACPLNDLCPSARLEKA
jgi:endonuclease-3